MSIVGKCHDCGGATVDYTCANCQHNEIERLREFPPLEVACKTCGGKGWYIDTYSDGNSKHGCWDCQEKCYIPTEFGKAVLRLIQRNLKLDDRQLPEWRENHL